MDLNILSFQGDRSLARSTAVLWLLCHLSTKYLSPARDCGLWPASEEVIDHDNLLHSTVLHGQAVDDKELFGGSFELC